MNKPDNKRIFLLIIILLTLVNLGFVLTVVLFRPSVNDDRPHRLMMEHPRHFMKEEIGFSDSQMETFKKYRVEFREETLPLHEKLQQLNRKLVKEATSENPDSTLCFVLSRQIGDVYTELKQVTSFHMMRVKKLATPEQTEKLTKFYDEMFQNDIPPPGQGRGARFRHRQGSE
ncbi:MAG TPA: hypothetical protein VK172_13060 [Lentimicrobium sp.]|nr:hypothetical protein [Lentimicrobium sp.]